MIWLLFPAAAFAGMLYISEPELIARLNKKPAEGGSLLSAIVEKGATLFPASVLNPESGHANPVVCIKSENPDAILKWISKTGLKLQKDSAGKICKE